MNEGWKCPACGKAHAPHVQTCPEPIFGVFTPNDSGTGWQWQPDIVFYPQWSHSQ